MKLSETVMGAIEGMIWSIGVMAVLIPITAFGPTLENAYYPVLTKFKILTYDRQKEYTLYDIQFDKVRDCDVEVGSFSWFVTDNFNRQERVLIDWPKHTGDPSTLVGTHVIKGVKVYNTDIDIKSQKIVAYHNCHLGWRTKSEVPVL